MSEYHTPVLLDESISALITNPSGTYVDATFGGGGHTAEILSRLSLSGRVIAFDRDSDAIDNKLDDLARSEVLSGTAFLFVSVFLQQSLVKITQSLLLCAEPV